MDTENIWNQFSEDIKRFVFSKTKDTVITDDILQEVFIKIHTHQKNLKDGTKLKSWIFTIANNTVLDYFKKHKNLNRSDSLITPATEKTENHNAVDCILPLILRLPKKYKDVLFLSTIKQYKHQKIAEELNISLAATKSRILRGKELLKQGFVDCCNYSIDDNGYLKGEHKDIDECKVCKPQHN
ncbi:sigma-70 family RNA polymerase sigma factor [Wenyingzhuangia sp. IMCC45533]